MPTSDDWQALTKASGYQKLEPDGPTPYLLIILDVLVSQAHEQLPEVLPLIVLPPLHVGLQIGVETLHTILTLLHVCRHLEEGHRGFMCVTAPPASTSPSTHTLVGGQGATVSAFYTLPLPRPLPKSRATVLGSKKKS